MRALRLLAVAALSLSISPSSVAYAVTPPGADPSSPTWEWPVGGPRDIVAPYRAPAHDYAAGHRGVDLAAGTAAVVRAPAPGVVAFRGTVVDRPLLTIEHPGGYVSTFEPLLSDLSPGDSVSAGDPIGTVDRGGHAAAGTLHLGVRLDGAYLNPLLLFGAVPRAVLLPCCETL
ncbi:M23 family metallopeptidase [Microbacterium sp. C5A9]|nr:M23 family metallopeptidase [Microbacterium sp. C5A9]